MGFSDVLKFIVISVAYLLSISVYAYELQPTRAQYPGYLDSVAEERYQVIEEMTLIVKPVSLERPLSERIFVDSLSREFKREYEIKFGRTDAERNITAPSRYDEYEYSIGRFATFEEDRENRRVFAEYMLRRLAEHHVDNYAKSTPSIRPVYEFKERIANVNIQVKKGYKLRFKYSYSGNFLDVRLENPYDIETKLSFRMDPTSFGPTEVQETIVNLGYNLGQGVGVQGQYLHEQQTISLVTTKALTPMLSASLTGSTYLPEADASQKQELVLVGLSWAN